MQRDPDARIQARDGRLEWGEDTFEYLTVKDPSELLWDEMDVDLVIEASGLFTNKDDASKHLDAGADRVLITAPAKGGVVTLCPGVNEDIYDPEEHRMVKVLA